MEVRKNEGSRGGGEFYMCVVFGSMRGEEGF